MVDKVRAAYPIPVIHVVPGQAMTVAPVQT
jgi:hypothetical protein